MATATTDEHFAKALLEIFLKDGVTPAKVDGIPVWATSDATIIAPMPAPDGMSGSVETVAAGGPARITVTADADMGAGIETITIVSEDVMVTPGALPKASVMKFTFGAPTPKA